MVYLKMPVEAYLTNKEIDEIWNSSFSFW